MYLYFNSKGVLEEVVNDIPTRKDSSNVNHIYVYIDGVAYNTDDKYYPLPDSIESLSTRYQLPDGTITPVALVQGKVQQSIPYDKHRDMKCFKDFYNYEFFDIELPSGVNEDGSQSEMPNVLGQSGLVALTIIEQPVGLALGLVVFNVEQEVGITTDTLITEAQFNYLMGYIADYKKKIDESVKANINKVDGLEKVTPANNIAKYQLNTFVGAGFNGAYARQIKGDLITANNITFDISNNSVKQIQINLIPKEDGTSEIANIQPNGNILTYRADLTNGNHEIRARLFTISDTQKVSVGDYVTIASSTNFGLYEPFTLVLSDTEAYVIYSKENSLSNQDIVAKKITIANGVITNVGNEFVIVSGTNQKDDEGNVVANSRPGFGVVAKLIDNTYIMLFESNVNNTNTDYPYVVQYIYFKDIEDKTTYTEPKTLFKVKNNIVNIPYVCVARGQLYISYHSTENYFGNPGDGLGIHKKVFEGLQSNRVVKYGVELTRNDFVNIPMRDNLINHWTGGWGSVFVWKSIKFIYSVGINGASSSTQLGLFTTTIEDLDYNDSAKANPNTIMKRDNNGYSEVATPEIYEDNLLRIINKEYLINYLGAHSSVNNTPNTLVTRSNGGFIYIATPGNLDPDTQPTLAVTKKYVGNYVSKTNTELMAQINELLNNKVSKLTTIEKAGSIVYGRSSVGTEEGVNYRSSAQYGSDLIYRDANGRAEIKDPVNNLDIANKEYVDTTINQKLASTYVYKGSVQTYADLPTDANIGDVYNVIEAYQNYPAGTNFAWTGTQWDALGGSVDLSEYPTKQEVANDLSKKLDKVSSTGTSNRMYVIAPNGSQYIMKATNSVVGGEQTIPIRDANGNFKVGTPKVDGDASNKKYVDDSISTKADKKDSHDFLYGGYVIFSLNTNPFSNTSPESGKINITKNDKLFTSGDITLMYTVPKRTRHIKGSKKWYSGARTKYCNRVFRKPDGTPITITPNRIPDETFFNISEVLCAILDMDRSDLEEHSQNFLNIQTLNKEEGKIWSTGWINGTGYVEQEHILPYYQHNVEIWMENVFKYNIYPTTDRFKRVKLYNFTTSKTSASSDLYTSAPFKYMSKKDARKLENALDQNMPICFQIKFIKNYQSHSSGKAWTGTMANLYLNVTMECEYSANVLTYQWCLNAKPFIFKDNARG